MYYNPTTREKITRDELKRRLNASFLGRQESIDGWVLLHNGRVPETQSGQSAVPAAVEFVDGRYVQTYEVSGSPQPEPASVEDRIRELEDALLEIAEIVGGE